MRDDSRPCHSPSVACMQPSTIITATRRRIGISLFSYWQQLERGARSSWRLARQVLYIARGHRTFVDQYELESDSRSDVTSNDASVKVNDTIDGAQTATMVFDAEAECIGSCVSRDCRSCDGGPFRFRRYRWNCRPSGSGREDSDSRPLAGSGRRSAHWGECKVMDVQTICPSFR